MSSNLQQRMDELIASGSVAAVWYSDFFIREIFSYFLDIEKNWKNAWTSSSMESRNDR
jgi:hypothetical protein